MRRVVLRLPQELVERLDLLAEGAVVPLSRASVVRAVVAYGLEAVSEGRLAEDALLYGRVPPGPARMLLRASKRRRSR